MKNFEERLERLERIASQLKSPETPLSEAMARFEEGVKLARTLEKDLEKMEKRVEILLTSPSEEEEGPEPNFELFTDLPE